MPCELELAGGPQIPITALLCRTTQKGSGVCLELLHNRLKHQSEQIILSGDKVDVGHWLARLNLLVMGVGEPHGALH